MSTQAALPISRKARQLIKRFDDVARSLAFVGSYAPEDRDEVKRFYEDAANKLRNYIADLETPKQPIAYAYDLATRIEDAGSKTPTYSGWDRRLSFEMPNVPVGSLRNLTPLVSAR